MPNKYKIAIADDHQIVRDSLISFLEEHGFNVVIGAENGEDLINQINSSGALPDLCIIDNNMPIMDGSKAIQIIKSKWAAIKIVAISLENTNEKNMMKQGADAFLLKEHMIELLCQTILELTN